MTFFLLIAIALITFAVLSWRNQKLGIILLFALLPTYLVRFSVGPIPSTLLEGFVLITIAIAVLRSKAPPPYEGGGWGEVLNSLGWYRIPLALAVIAGIISTIIAPDILSALGILKAYIIEPILLAFVITSIMVERADIERIIDALVASATVVGVLAILQALTHVGIPDAWAIEHRATSLFDYPNAVGLFIAPIMVMAMVRLFTPSDSPLKKRKTFTGGAVLLMLGGIFAAKTEAALVAIPVALAIIGLIAPLSARIKYGIVALSITGACAMSVFAPSIIQKITLHDSSGLVRRAQWSETLTMLADRPLLGAGLNGYPTALAPYHDATFYEIFQYPHNIFLNVWSEMGLIGLIGLIVCAILVTRTTWRRKDDALILAFAAALLVMLIHGLVDVPFFKNDLAILTVFCVMGMMVKKEA